MTSSRLPDVEQLHVEDECGVGWDHAAGALCPVTKVGRERQRSSSADLHARDSLVPAADHFTGAQSEGERLATIPRAVELPPLMVRFASVVEPFRVMHYVVSI